MMALLIYEPVFTDYVGMGKGKFMFVVVMLFGALEPLSRMMVGSHSANEVIFGTTLGMAILVLYRFYLQEALYRIYFNILAKRKTCVYATMIVVCALIYLIIPVIFYSVNVQNRPVD